MQPLTSRLLTTARGLLGRIEQRVRALREPPKSAPTNASPAAPPAAVAPASPPAPKPVNWELRSQADLVDHIVGHYHEGLRRDLPRLIAAARGAGTDVPGGLVDHLESFANELESHMAKEERILFPVLRTGQRGGQIDMPIRMMEREHEGHDDALAELRALTSDLTAPAGAPAAVTALYAELRALESALREHIYLENNVLFARAAGGEY